MAIRLYEGRMEFDYDSSDGSVKTTHTVYIESDGLYFDGTIYGTGSPGVFIDSTVSSDSSGLSTGDFEFQPNQIAFGTNTLFAKADGSGVVFSGTIGATLDSSFVPHTQGLIAGYQSGGTNAGQSTYIATIDRFPFSISSGNATDVGDITFARWASVGQSSSNDGFTSGGLPVGGGNRIDKFPFSNPFSTATDVGDLSLGRSETSSQYSETNGFTTGGNPIQGRIDKFPFSISSGTATDVADQSVSRRGSAGQSSTTNGFDTGGLAPALNSTIDKFPFSISSGTATDVGDLSQSKHNHSGQQSNTNGFASGGGTPTKINSIDKFPFSISSGTATDVGDLSEARDYTVGNSSNVNGYSSGGHPATPTVVITTIDRFPFSISSGVATNVGNLSEAKKGSAGQQD